MMIIIIEWKIHCTRKYFEKLDILATQRGYDTFPRRYRHNGMEVCRIPLKHVTYLIHLKKMYKI